MAPPLTAPRRLLLCITLLSPLTALAFEITYHGEFMVERQLQPTSITHNAIPVTRYVSVVTTVSPVTDAVDSDGGLHCWYMIDRERGFKAMIAGQPIDSTGPTPFGAGDSRPADEELGEIVEFVSTVYHEAQESGGIEELSARCGAPS